MSPLYCRDNCSVSGSIVSRTSVIVMMSSFTIAAIPSTSCVFCAQVRDTPTCPTSRAHAPRYTASPRYHPQLRNRPVTCRIRLPPFSRLRHSILDNTNDDHHTRFQQAIRIRHGNLDRNSLFDFGKTASWREQRKLGNGCRAYGLDFAFKQ